MLRSGRWLLVCVLGWTGFQAAAQAQSPSGTKPVPVQGFQPPTLSLTDGYRVKGVGMVQPVAPITAVGTVGSMGMMQSNANQPGSLKTDSFLGRVTEFFSLKTLNRSLRGMGLLKPPPEPPVVILPDPNSRVNDQ